MRSFTLCLLMAAAPMAQQAQEAATVFRADTRIVVCRSEEHTSELQSRQYLASSPTRRSSDLCVPSHSVFSWRPRRWPSRRRKPLLSFAPTRASWSVDRKSTRLNSSHANISPLPLHDALPIYAFLHPLSSHAGRADGPAGAGSRYCLSRRHAHRGLSHHGDREERSSADHASAIRLHGLRKQDQAGDPQV